MDGLFSHAAAADQPVPEHRTRTVAVSVPVPPAEAFAAFTDLIHLWWPVELQSAYGPGSHLGFEAQALVEESDDGREQVWGTVRSWAPPSSLVLDLGFGVGSGEPSRVRVDFDAEPDGTAVAVAVDGGSRTAGSVDWEPALRSFARFMGVAGASLRIDPEE